MEYGIITLSKKLSEENYMGLFDKLREPVVLKEDSSAKKQL